MKKTIFATLLVASFGTANAGLLDGQTLRVVYLFPDSSTAHPGNGDGDYVVGAGIEVINLLHSNIFDVDLQSDGFNVIFNNFASFGFSSFNGFRITDINSTIPSFTSFTQVSNTAGADPILSFDADNLYVNWQDIEMSPGSIQFHVTAVPEPETYAMLLAGLGLLGFVARRRKETAV